MKSQNHLSVSQLLQRLSADVVVCPSADECTLLLAHIRDAEQGPEISDDTRNIALRLCKQDNANCQAAGMLLLKEMGKRGDLYAKLIQAKLHWAEGPYKNHSHALRLANELMKSDWKEWPYQERARVALGDLFRLKGLLLWRGEKIKPNPSEALNHFKFASDKYLDGFSAWIAAQFHAKDSHIVFAHLAKPNTAAYDFYMARAKELGYVSASKSDESGEQA
jgi:hypothetical protein